MPGALQIPDFIAVTLGFTVFLLGSEINRRFAVLRRFNMPEPVTGGLLATLIGGQGTVIASAPKVASVTGLDGATELGVAVAMLGLVLAALIGGPIARYLVERHNVTPDRSNAPNTIGLPDTAGQGSAAIEHRNYKYESSNQALWSIAPCLCCAAACIRFFRGYSQCRRHPEGVEFLKDKPCPTC